MLLQENRNKQGTFLRYIFRENEGFVCFARINRTTKDYNEEFFEWPQQAEECLVWVDSWSPTHDTYFCPQLLSRNDRKKNAVDKVTCAWADLDTCDPEKLLITPTISVKTSQGRWQAYWVFPGLTDPSEAEDISRRIAYYHADDGADKSGWDLTQLLRVPYTLNHKYRGVNNVVAITHAGGLVDKADLLDKYPQARGHEYSDVPFPEELPDPEEVLHKYRFVIAPTAMKLVYDIPDVSSDWSKLLWNLEMLMYEAGFSKEEMFAVARISKCNKYARDGRHETLLWKEVCKAHMQRESELHLLPSRELKKSPILSDTERDSAEGIHTVVDDYIDWGKSAGDAAWQYHQASAFVILSSLLSANIRLPTTFGTYIPNLWVMLLADTTLTRKTTAMGMATDILQELDPDIVLATDGSMEGLLSSLQNRPDRASLFLRDEFTELIESFSKKDYHAGMLEAFTRLYDSKYQKRKLRKEEFIIRNPIFILFVAGIRSRMVQQLSYKHVDNGFLPRFIIVTAEADINKMQPIGPPVERVTDKRDAVKARFAEIADHYQQQSRLGVGGKNTSATKFTNAQLTPDAWLRYNRIESEMMVLGYDSHNPEILTPTFQRLCVSGLKCAALIAASRRLDDNVIVTEEDLCVAFRYVEMWREDTLQIVNNLGKTDTERELDKVLKMIEKEPGVMRSRVMQSHHLTAKDIGPIIDTLEQRGMIQRDKKGRAEYYYPI